MPSQNADRARLRIAQDIAGEAEQAVAHGHPADRTLSTRFRAHREYGSRDRRFYAEVMFSLFRWRGWSGTLAEEGPPALFRAHWLDAQEPDPAIRAAAAEAGMPWAAMPGWGGLPLRARAEALATAEGHSAAPRPETLVPAWAPEALAPDAGSVTSWIEAFQVRPPLWLRAVGIDGPALCGRLQQKGIFCRVHPVLRSAVVLDGHPHLGNLAKSLGACFDVQDLSAQAVVACADPQPGETWWDACAGSGGKALAIASRVGPTGRVWATDRRPDAVREMARRIRASAVPVPHLSPGIRDAARPPPRHRFDGVLLDAPCSGLGTWPRNPDARWRTTPAMIEACARIQARLLRATADAVRPGGRLVYAVCTASRRETTDQIESFLKERPEYRPGPVPAPLGGDPGDRHRVHPSAGPCSGMFMAVLRRATDP